MIKYMVFQHTKKAETPMVWVAREIERRAIRTDAGAEKETNKGRSAAKFETL